MYEYLSVCCMFTYVYQAPSAGGGPKRIADPWNWSWLWATMQVWELNLRPLQEGQVKWKCMVWTHSEGFFANYLHVLVLLALCCWAVCHDSIESKSTKNLLVVRWGLLAASVDLGWLAEWCQLMRLTCWGRSDVWRECRVPMVKWLDGWLCSASWSGVFADLHDLHLTERGTAQKVCSLGWSCFPPADSCPFCWGLAVSVRSGRATAAGLCLLTCHCWPGLLVYSCGICKWIKRPLLNPVNWTIDFLTAHMGFVAKNNFWTGPLPLCPNSLSFSLPLVGSSLEGKVKHLKTVIKRRIWKKSKTIGKCS